MNKAEKVAYIMDELQRLYPKPPVPLDHTDPYTLLIAVLLSAQCTDERVNQVTPELFDLARTPQQMVQLSVDQIKAIIRSNGKNVEQTERDAKRLFPRERWNDLHLQIIFYAREYSPARGLKWERDFLLQRCGRATEIKKWKPLPSD